MGETDHQPQKAWTDWLIGLVFHLFFILKEKNNNYPYQSQRKDEEREVDVRQWMEGSDNQWYCWLMKKPDDKWRGLELQLLEVPLGIFYKSYLTMKSNWKTWAMEFF